MEKIVSDLLEEDHDQLATIFAELQSALTTPVKSKAFEMLDLFWARLAMHIRAENVCLFPAILNVAESVGARGAPTSGEVASALEVLRNDHNFFMDQLARAVKTMREISAGDMIATGQDGKLEEIRNRVTSVGDRLVSHNELEEEQVYRWPALFLSSSELQNLLVRLKRELTNLPPRFGQ